MRERPYGYQPHRDRRRRRPRIPSSVEIDLRLHAALAGVGPRPLRSSSASEPAEPWSPAPLSLVDALEHRPTRAPGPRAWQASRGTAARILSCLGHRSASAHIAVAGASCALRPHRFGFTVEAAAVLGGYAKASRPALGVSGTQGARAAQASIAADGRPRRIPARGISSLGVAGMRGKARAQTSTIAAMRACTVLRVFMRGAAAAQRIAAERPNGRSRRGGAEPQARQRSAATRIAALSAASGAKAPHHHPSPPKEGDAGRGKDTVGGSLA